MHCLTVNSRFLVNQQVSLDRGWHCGPHSAAPDFHAWANLDFEIHQQSKVRIFFVVPLVRDGCCYCSYVVCSNLFALDALLLYPEWFLLRLWDCLSSLIFYCLLSLWTMLLLTLLPVIGFVSPVAYVTGLYFYKSWSGGKLDYYYGGGERFPNSKLLLKI